MPKVIAPGHDHWHPFAHSWQLPPPSRTFIRKIEMPESCRSFGSAAKRGELQKQLEINHLEQGQGVVNNAILFVVRRQNYSENCYSPFSGRGLTSDNKDVSIVKF